MISMKLTFGSPPVVGGVVEGLVEADVDDAVPGVAPGKIVEISIELDLELEEELGPSIDVANAVLVGHSHVVIVPIHYC
jgi:hypothetical protein